MNLSTDEVVRVQQQIMKYYYGEVIPLVPFIKETLEVLRPKYALGIATSCDRGNANLALQRFNLLPYFKALTFGEDVTRGKPDPEIFLRTAKLLEIYPKRCAVVEDSNPGFKAGKAAGMLVIARLGNHNMDTDFSSADFIVEDVREIPKILASQG